MKVKTDFSTPEETKITEEASKKLIEVILQIQNGLIKSWASLPPHFQILFKLAKIKLNLQDNAHDKIKVDIRIEKIFKTRHTITKFKKTGFVFGVECLAPNIEKTVDEAFKKITLMLINQISEGLRGTLERLTKEGENL